MPEGDTIWRTAVALRGRLLGKTITEARPAMLRRLEGTTVTGVDPVGKHLLVRFSSDLVLHSHMQMRGSWHLYAPGERWRQPERLARAVLTCDDTVAVCFSAPVVELTRQPAARLAHLGPDILSADFEAAAAVERARLLDDLALGEVLLDQRVCAGIGNVYRCEVLWQLKLDPWSRVKEHADSTLVAIYDTVQKAMLSNLGWGGRRFAYGRAAVHGRGNRPCPRCHSLIRVRRQGEHGRFTYYCPACQQARASTTG
jgi:endonuclease-8